MLEPATYTYAVEVERDDGTPVGQLPVNVDWEPAREWVRLLALRGGWPAGDAFTRDLAVEPLWDPERGAPRLAGFRIQLAGVRECDAEFPTAYFRDLARTTTARMVADGTLQKGDLIRCHALAFRVDAPAPGEQRPRLGRPAAPDIPVRRALLADVLPSHDAGTSSDAVDPDDLPVLIPDRVLEEARALTAGAGPSETGGVLVGHLYRDPDRAVLFAEVTAQVPARHTEANATKLTFTPATWTEVRAALALRNRGEIMLGWWHSHPVREWCKKCPEERRRQCALARGFLSDDDRLLHRTVFPRAYSVALVASDVEGGPTFTLFGWRRGLLEERTFHLSAENAHAAAD
jgi:proteasome lid subunit RPN8/RPN11